MTDWFWGLFAGLILIGIMAQAEGRWDEACGEPVEPSGYRVVTEVER